MLSPCREDKNMQSQVALSSSTNIFLLLFLGTVIVVLIVLCMFPVVFSPHRPYQHKSEGMKLLPVGTRGTENLFMTTGEVKGIGTNFRNDKTLNFQVLLCICSAPSMVTRQNSCLKVKVCLNHCSFFMPSNKLGA